MVVAGILVVADPDAGQLEETDHGREDLLPRQAGTAQVLLDPLPEPGQCLAERQHAAEFGFVAYLAPSRMVAVLLPAASVPSGRLDMAVGVLGDPDIGVGRRHRERADPGERRAVGDAPPIG